MADLRDTEAVYDRYPTLHTNVMYASVADVIIRLETELEAARAIVACWRRQPPYFDDCDPGQNDPYYAWNAEMIGLVVAYEAIVKAGEG